MNEALHTAGPVELVEPEDVDLRLSIGEFRVRGGVPEGRPELVARYLEWLREQPMDFAGALAYALRGVEWTSPQDR